MRISFGYRNLVAALLAAASTLGALPPASLSPGPGPLTQAVVQRAPAKATRTLGRVAPPTAKMVAEAEVRASRAATRQKFDIYRKRLYNRHAIARFQSC